MIGAELKRYDASQRYCVFDGETFNLNLMNNNPPWQFSWILATKDHIIDTQNHYLNWHGRFRMSAGAAKITGYQEELIQRAGEEPEDVWELFFKVLQDDSILLVGQNILNFDIYTMNQWARYINKDHNYEYIDRCIDTNCLAKAIKLRLKLDLQEFLAAQFRLTNFHRKDIKTSLGTLVKEYKIDMGEENYHKAEFDIIANWEVFRKQLWQIEI